MRFKSSFIIGLALAASSIPAAAAVTAGAVVKDTSGGVVGTILRVEGDQLMLRTDRHEVRLPVASFTATDDGALFGMTGPQLDADIDRVQAAAAAQIVAGATVKGVAGNIVGTIEAIDELILTLKLISGKTIRLPRNAVGGSPDGPVIGLTAEQMEAEARKAS